MEGLVLLTYMLILTASKSHGGISDHCCTNSECAFLKNGYCKPSEWAGPDMCKRRKREALEPFRERPEGGATWVTTFRTVTPGTRETMASRPPIERLRKGTCQCKPGYSLLVDVCTDGAEKTHVTDGIIFNKTICYKMTCTGPRIGCTLDIVSNEREQPEGRIESCEILSLRHHCITVATRTTDSVIETTGCAEDCREETGPNRTVSCCLGNYCNANNTSPFVDSSTSSGQHPLAFLFTSILVLMGSIILNI